MIKPARLQPGMTIGIIAPASAARDPIHVDHAVHGLEMLGFQVKVGRHVQGRHGFLAATDQHRLSDLHTMFADKKVDGIMCLRGGYGTTRIVDDIDFALVKKNPKVFIGFSDITMLNLAFWKHCKLVSFNGPMAASTLADTTPSRFSVSSFLRTLGYAEAPGSIWQGHSDRDYRVVRTGEASGRLTGGNLSLVAASLGTKHEIQTRGTIVFLEEIDEKPYGIDRMLTQLLSAGKLKDAAGIVIGRNVPHKDFSKWEKQAAESAPRNVKPLPSKLPREFEPLNDDVFYDRLRPLGIPVLIGLPFGHIQDYTTLPIGIRATISTRTGDLTIDEPAVK